MSKELKTGIVAVVIIAFFVWGYNFLKGQNLFDGNTRYFKVEYNQIGGLTKSSFVTINGLKVGKVENIKFNQTPEKRGHLIVEFSVEDEFEFSKNSIVKIYSPSPLSPSNLAIIPSYQGENAITGDVLIGEIESSLFTSIGERLDPLQSKLEHVIVSADSLFKNINNVLDLKTQTALKESVQDLSYTIKEIKGMMLSVNSVIDSTSAKLKITISNTKKITDNLTRVSDTLANANIGGIIRKAEATLTSSNKLLNGINQGKGTLGKLVVDDKLYHNLTTMSKELENLLREMKENPKRFVHFSLFGKRAKPYTPNKDKEANK
ncbi:MlaD family protein [Polaribacter aquimarinus]|uniref:MCE family protein n=1 Tax=Polaribacter aquimarinus TaxID=2100726 RepID=A0A2U2JAB7_9FLAO|nr:MlaD family protein [Polaribacter aquimarinus]PWG05279.1 MCE family protein [Polaribacter aquimarinus]